MGLNRKIEDALLDMEEQRMTDTTDVQRYADASMYQAAPMTTQTPKVYLLSMTDDPLGAIAAACRMYEGIPTYNLSSITDQERNDYLQQVQKTHLTAPLEFVKLHFFLEGVDRAFTHQLVRQRTAVYAQESLRFAVKETLRDEVPYPPSLMDPERSVSGSNDLKDTWDQAVAAIDSAYQSLIANGVPAEDARGLLPHAVTTRLNYATDLRNLIGHAGNRLCTQAQFAWRTVFVQIVEAIRNYGANRPDAWQFEALADSGMFKPVCYQLGHCPFKADFDRGCTIRGRVDEMAAHGVPSTQWNMDQPNHINGTVIPAIKDEEWLADPKAAWQ